MSKAVATMVEAGGIPAVTDPQALLARAIEQNVSIDTLERLLALREKLRAEQAEAMFFAALAAFQGECPIIPKTKTAEIRSERGSFKYTFAPLDVIVKHVSPILQRHGLSYTIDTHFEDAGLVAVCTVHHVGGHSRPSTFRVPIDKAARMNDTQKIGSAGTYAKRYAFCNALGILTGEEDNDAGTTDQGGGGGKPLPPRPRARSTGDHGTSGAPPAVVATSPEPGEAGMDSPAPSLTAAVLAGEATLSETTVEMNKRIRTAFEPTPDEQAALLAEVFPGAEDLTPQLAASVEATKRNPDDPISEADRRKLYGAIRSGLIEAKQSTTEANMDRAKDHIKEWLGRQFGVEHIEDIPQKHLVAVKAAIPRLVREVWA